MYLLQIFSLILLKSILIHSELFTSITHLTQLLTTEIQLAEKLETYLKEEYERLNQIEKFLNEIRDEINQAKGNEGYYFGNPINSYLFIKHLTVDWQSIEELLPEDLSKNISENLLLPSADDHIGSALGVMRLQDTYRLSADQLANGEISSKFKSRRLTALECYELGYIAYNNTEYYHASMWMLQALDYLDKETIDTSIDKFDILDDLANAIYQQGAVEQALAVTEELLLIDPDNVRIKHNKILYETVIKTRTLADKPESADVDINNSTDLRLILTNRKDKGYKTTDRQQYISFEERQIYEQLCRQNEPKLSAEREAKLFCRYRHNNHPYLILQPVKEEQMLDEPAVFLFHDVLSNADIEQMKSLATSKLARSGVLNRETGGSNLVTYRVSKSAWFYDEDSPAVARLTRLIEAVTNLNMKTAEPLQIANYGVGGHYEPHFDYFSLGKNDSRILVDGNRIATWLTYLSDVELGGATVFPRSDGHVKPKKGSATFWYNLHASGEVDPRTRHAGCPVLIGNKWIANKWILERGQEFRRPCSLDPMV